MKPLDINKWTDANGKVLIVKCVSLDGKAHGGFQHPMTVGETVEAPDWNDKAECGGGIHGWPWGLNLGEGKEPDYLGLWLVYSVDPKLIVDLSGKVKFKSGELVYSGPWAGALSFTLNGRTEYVVKNSSGSASNSGDRGSASNSGDSGSASNSGDRGSASNSGDRGSASNSGYSGSASNSGYSGSASNSGDRGSASNSGYSGSASNSGYRGSASNSGYSGSASNSGYRGSASNSGYRGSASNSGYSGSASNSGDSGSASNSGDSGSASNSGYRGSAESVHPGTAAIVTGIEGRAKGPDYGCIGLAWLNAKKDRVEMRCALTGLGGTLKANTWYNLSATGEFQEITIQS